MPPTDEQLLGPAGSPVPLADTAAVRRWLRARVIATAEDPVSASPIAGGVSAVVLDVSCGSARFVLKQARHRLAVNDDWYADVSRLVHEGHAARFFGVLTPDHVPRVIDLDEAVPALLLQRAPSRWAEWRGVLLSHDHQPRPIPGLGAMLAAWHTRARLHPDELGLLAGPGETHFHQLRLEPFLATTAERAPQYADDLHRCWTLLQPPGPTLVHGDFSPKNILVGDDGFWVLDFEVAHLGHPVFDIAFLLTHLGLKAVARPEAAELYGHICDRFCVEYWSAADADVIPELADLRLVIGCLMLARVHGRSPVNYLDAARQAEVERRAQLLLGDSRPSASASHQDNPWPRLKELMM